MTDSLHTSGVQGKSFPGRRGVRGERNWTPGTNGRGRLLRGQSGYSLLEVLIALSILATGLTVLLATQGNSNQQTVFSSELTRASMLARSKMVDLEYEVMKDGLSTDEQYFDGDFRDEGYEDVRWSAKVEPVEIPEEAREELLAKINSQLFGGVDGEGGALQGNAAFSSMLPTLIAQLPEIINRIGEKVRRVELKVEFPYMGDMYPITVVQYIVDRNDADFQLFEAAEAP